MTSPVGTIVRKVFTGWSGDSSADTAAASLTVDGAKSVTANWRTDYTQLYMIAGGLAALLVALLVASLIVVVVVIRR